jgi:hypothetical protein
VSGDADQLAVLEMWLARGTARSYGEPDMPRRPDATAVHAALRRATGGKPSGEAAKLLAIKL